MAKEVPEFEYAPDCLFEMLSWDDTVQVSDDESSSGSVATAALPVPSSSTPSHVPLEIWNSIIRHLTEPDDVTWTWLSLRRVSRSFKAAVETAVRSQVLRPAKICFVAHKTTLVRSSKPPMLSQIKLGTIETHLDRFSEDGERVFFRDKTALKRMGTYILGHTVEDWRTRVGSYLGEDCGSADHIIERDALALGDTRRVQYNQPPHVISMGGMVNDTELPGLEVDTDRLEISFLWKPMLTLFLAEEDRVRHLVRTVQMGRHSSVGDIRRQKAWTLQGLAMIRTMDQIRRKVRCYRFEHNHQRKGNPLGWASSIGQPLRVEEHLRLAYMRGLRDSLAKEQEL